MYLLSEKPNNELTSLQSKRMGNTNNNHVLRVVEFRVHFVMGLETQKGIDEKGLGSTKF